MGLNMSHLIQVLSKSYLCEHTLTIPKTLKKYSATKRDKVTLDLREKVWSINQFPTYWWLELSRFVRKWERELFSQYISANEMAFFRWGKCLESFNLKDNMSPHEQLKYQIDFLIQMWLYLSLWLFNRDKFLRNLKHRENLQDFTFVAGLSLIFTQHIINLLTFQCRIIK